MFIEQAFKGKNDTWRFLIVILLTTAIFLFNFVAVFTMSPEEMQAMYDSMKIFPKNVMLAASLGIFVPLLAMLFLLVYFIHERSILSLTTARPTVDYRRIFFSFMLITILAIVSFIASYYIDNSQMVWNFNSVPFTILLVISLVLFPFQIGFEEYLFRGYLMQQVGIMARNRWFPLLLTSVVFGIFHTANPEVAELGFGVMVFYIGTGLLLGIMTLMDDSLELAIGFHLGNNLMAALLITSDFSALQTDALFRYTGIEDSSAILTEMMVTMAVMYPIVLLIFAKKYKWNGWREKLTGKVVEPILHSHSL